MKKKTGFIALLVIAVLLLLCGTAMADGQTNPRRQHVLDSISWRNQKRPGAYLASPYITVACNITPTLAAPGKFTVTVNNDDGSDLVLEYAISDEDRDPNGYIYFGSATESRVFDDFTFYTPGNYTLFVFLYERNGNYLSQKDYARYRFTVAANSNYPTLEQKAESIVNQCRASDTWQTALNLHDWLTHNLYYDRNYEYYGADAIFRGKGVCDSYSKAFSMLCYTAGIGVRRVTSDAQNHAWNLLQIGSEWYQVDVTWDDPSGSTEAVSGSENYNYFCLSDEVMYLDHSTYDELYGINCDSMTMNYYLKKNLWEQFGNYGYYDGETVIAYFQEKLDQGETDISFSLNDWGYYWTEDGWGHGMRPVQYYIYVAGMKQKTWTLSSGSRLSVEIILNLDDRFVSMKVTGGILSLPDGTITIGEYAFEGIPAAIVRIPEGCTTIKAGAFRNSGVKTVYAPESLVNIADSAFDGCTGIRFILNGKTNNTVSEFAQIHGFTVE